ncbi:hypothetical protein AB6A40_010288 [Gnathostoma spinigerum]|uniref:DUF7819 domain-containing protein n=1 Tax=Gnathostoma spinigerum TaxID=75299 RepID=A0ABD6EUD0_9BILA
MAVNGVPPGIPQAPVPVNMPPPMPPQIQESQGGNRRERRSRFDQKVAVRSTPDDGDGQPDGDYGKFFNVAPPSSAHCPSPRDIYHARPDDTDEPSFMCYDEDEYGRGDSVATEQSSIVPEAKSLQGPSFSRPPPAHPPSMFDDSALIPNCPYYELPAGMMLPFIGMDDILYKPVAVSQLRLPPPIPPSERLIHAMDMFYAPPTSDSPRDNDGWERLGLFEYYAKKNEIKRKIEEKLKAEGKTLEDAIENVFIQDDNDSGRESSPKRSRSRSRSPSRPSRDSSKSSRSSRRTRSRSSRRKRSHSHSSCSSRSRSRSNSKSPARRRKRGIAKQEIHINNKSYASQGANQRKRSLM